MRSALPYNAIEQRDCNHSSDSDELLQEDIVPYSSSSMDRSSIGSIPWADDAIKKNQLDWERVEHMLSGKEPLPEGEAELRNEILEWQRKFPQLINNQQSPKQVLRKHTQSINGTLDLDVLTNLHLNSIDDVEFDEDGDAEGLLTPTKQWLKHSVPTTCKTKHFNSKLQNTVGTLTQLLDRDLCINSIPVTLRKRQPHLTGRIRKISSDDSCCNSDYSSHHSLQRNSSPKHLLSPFLQVPHSPRQQAAARRLRMPPILNVLETKRHFRGLVSNRSFVQLTQVQQQHAQHKSAVVTPPIASATTRQTRNKSAWHMPLAATTVNNRFFNNRNAIILPAINLQHIGVHHATATTVTATTTTSDGGSSTYQLVPNAYHNFTRSGTMTTTSSTGGRSISAAVHPRSEFRAFYLHYSATKFKSFK